MKSLLDKLFGRRHKPEPFTRPRSAMKPVEAVAGPRARRAETRRDQILAADAASWMLELPRSVTPMELSRCYPRICNQLALVWPDSHLTQACFETLLIDDRGGMRAGFPPLIAQELIALHEFYERHMSTPDKVKAWDNRMLAVGDR